MWFWVLNVIILPQFEIPSRGNTYFSTLEMVTSRIPQASCTTARHRTVLGYHRQHLQAAATILLQSFIQMALYLWSAVHPLHLRPLGRAPGRASALFTRILVAGKIRAF